ncbi:hypothetical protein [Entomospira culicis]|uniref:Uncharacterized protein n=1 Tax=Entomospira culicis TaxID=2719989 RepID=A0A968GIC8_9SPIO|nr:hypothetical protein [Entomospira culicis]NIZ18980.1 hypothetical protein [Entomospira culicis]NIZ69195.1 hypothetical protein [Entomospira culicis]WDI37781.1 hypothetical protein PVA46_03070 [Entomospira culicis]WDI39409.1 hypothetical protein PVA47_03075 [Entomospira culicis]
MKRIVTSAIIAFLIALVINIILGVVRSSFKIGLILTNSIATFVIVLFLLWIIKGAVERFLPELNEPLAEKNGEEEGDSSSPEHGESGDDFSRTDMHNSESVSTGQRVNVVLDDAIENPYYSRSSSDSFSVEGGEQETLARSKDLSAESFAHESPEVLAQAVRTALGRDDS